MHTNWNFYLFMEVFRMGNLLKGKNILIMGVRNKWSIAWGIVQAAKENGANVIITYLSDREEKAALDLISDAENAFVYKCDISSDSDIDNLFKEIKSKYGSLHGIVHSIAHAKTEDLQNNFVFTSREGFLHAMNISAYSLVAVCRGARDVMTNGGSIITLSYMGSEKVFPGYNVMGVAKAALETSVKYLAYDLGSLNIRVNAISAGPMKTLSAKGVKNFGSMIENFELKAPFKGGLFQEDLGASALFYLSDLSRAITGEVTHVDCGFNIMGV